MIQNRDWLLAQAEKHSVLAKKYRAILANAELLGQPDKNGAIRGPYGNARDPKRGWTYTPRIRRAAINHELMARNLRKAAAE